tara:strand:+ start:776 stop:1954 length:1179 start_codon:yes stop_codon:yes gene_type:complete
MLELIGRDKELFVKDILDRENIISSEINKSRFLVLGGAGSIGKAVTKEIFKRNPLKLDVIDISENNLVELVRDIRSTYGYISGKFSTYVLDIGSHEYDVFIENDGLYDYVLNLSALKHVRSEKDPYTLMRMINVNIINTIKTINQSKQKGVKKYFCVSTDKAANPVNMMGASKKIMEMFLQRESSMIKISTARFANVAFSDGSLLFGFKNRFNMKQPIVAPIDIKRYFILPKEAGELCLLSCLFGDNMDIFFPKLDDNLHLISFSEIAKKFIISKGYEPNECKSEDYARENSLKLISKKKWPCLFSKTNTTGEKPFEEFYTENEILDYDKFNSVGIIKNKTYVNEDLDKFLNGIIKLKNSNKWEKNDILDLFNSLLPKFNHQDLGRYLDSKM